MACIIKNDCISTYFCSIIHAKRNITGKNNSIVYYCFTAERNIRNDGRYQTTSSE